LRTAIQLIFRPKRKLGTLFARAGHEVVFSYARSEEKLRRLARAAHGNARAGTPAEAARDADALLLAVHWSRVGEVLKQAGDEGPELAYRFEWFGK
jgi:predicted dinucleotide-binding enzyme